MGLNVDLALEMLCLCDLAERFRGAQFDTLAEPTSTFLNLRTGNPAKPVRVRGSPIRAPKGLVANTGRADTECFVARTDAGDVVVAFRSSETRLFGNEGAFKDWFLTDLQSTRVHYPPAPGSTGDRRWVHSGFWHAYDPLRSRLLTEVARQADRGGKARAVYVTGFSLGGALAVLAALDIADALRSTDVHLVSIAAPRTGDASLNKLLDERAKSACSIGFRSDPTVHVPPIGPNLPLTFTHAVKIDIGSVQLGLGRPVVPQFAQQYRTPGDVFYIDADYVLHERWPAIQLALNFLDHNFARYRNALYAVRHDRREAEVAIAAAPRDGRIDGVLQMMFSGAPA
ncbi:MAG: lipase family protein [Candidatus Accumulibacter meliphilus]|jgi:hypothetical protein|uniref:lipase family protein n=1 Tax=Candidatus Accumulibacter meliphilus TaxID=2211374 RepID=UPI002FC39C90